MQLARAQDEGLRHNHLKIHKVRNDASRGRDLGVKFYFECKVRKGEEPWSGKSKYGNWVRLVYVINSSLNASVNSKQKPLPAGLCWEIVASARNVALIEMQIKQFQFGTQKWNKNERILYKWSASYTFRILSIWSGNRSRRGPYSQKYPAGMQQLLLQLLRFRCPMAAVEKEIIISAYLHATLVCYVVPGPETEDRGTESGVRRGHDRPTDSEHDSMTDWLALACGFSYWNCMQTILKLKLRFRNRSAHRPTLRSPTLYAPPPAILSIQSKQPEWHLRCCTNRVTVKCPFQQRLTLLLFG